MYVLAKVSIFYRNSKKLFVSKNWHKKLAQKIALQEKRFLAGQL